MATTYADNLFTLKKVYSALTKVDESANLANFLMHRTLQDKPGNAWKPFTTFPE